VGKGQARRAWVFRGRGRYHQNWLDQLAQAPIVEVVEYFDVEEAALSKEIELIAKLKAQGCKLTNLSSGGEGVSSPDDDTRALLAASKRGERNPAKRADVRQKIASSLRGCKHSKETRVKRALACRGRVWSEASRKKLSLSMKEACNFMRGRAGTL